MSRLGLALALLLGVLPRAWAEDPPPGDADRVPGLDATSPGMIPGVSLAPVHIVEGAGLKVGEGTVVHSTLGADTGFTDNVFYEESGTAAAGLFRLVATFATGSLPALRLRPTSGGRTNLGSFQHGEELRLSYDFHVSGNDYVSGQNGLGIGAVLRGHVNPQGTWSFLYLNNFERVTRAPNFESAARLNRDINRLSLGVQFAPTGRNLRGLAYYENTIDFFEKEDHRFANTMRNIVGLTTAWRVRPVTVLFANASWGAISALGDMTAYANPKSGSYPLSTMVGIQTLLSLKTTVAARFGYTNGFYSAGPSYSNVTGGVDVGYRYSPLGRFALQYQYVYADSINANFYRDHVAKLRIDQQFIPFSVEVVPELHLRRYEGITTLVPGVPDTREDVIFQLVGAVRYYFRDSMAVVVQYKFTTDQTDYRYTLDMRMDDPSFTRHELVAGFRAGL